MYTLGSSQETAFISDGSNLTLMNGYLWKRGQDVNRAHQRLVPAGSGDHHKAADTREKAVFPELGQSWACGEWAAWGTGRMGRHARNAAQSWVRPFPGVPGQRMDIRWGGGKQYE